MPVVKTTGLQSLSTESTAQARRPFTDPLTALLRVIEVQCSSLKLLSLTADEAAHHALCGPALYWVLSEPSPVSVSVADTSAIVEQGDLFIVTASGPYPLAFHQPPTPGHLQPTSQWIAAELTFGRNDVESLVSLLPPILKVPSAMQHPALKNVLTLLRHEADVEQAGYGAIADAMVQTVFALALRHEQGINGDACETLFQTPVEIGIVSTLLMMRNHLDSQWTVDQLADLAGMSRSRYAVRFTEFVRQTPMRYLFESRMSRAGDLLQQDHYGLKEIARLIGYKSTSAFSTAFKKWSGKSPQEYRKQV